MSPQPQTGPDAGSVRLDPARLDRLHGFLESRVAEGALGAVALAVWTGDGPVAIWTHGTCDGVRPVGADTRFLVASLSKPVAAAAAMRLVEAGEVTLATPVSTILPELRGAGRERIRLIHLLTHTSGLPDMVPENVALRRAQAPLSDFFAAVCRTELLFEPGTANVYQSMGFVVLSTLIERLTGLAFADFVRTELFARIGLAQSDFGRRAGSEPADEVQVTLPEDQLGTDFHWNSDYWRSLGAPWGGLITTAGDLVLFLREFVTPQHITPAVARAMTQDALAGLGPQFASWGLGFKLKGTPPGTIRPLAVAAQAAGRSDSFTSPGAAHGRSFFGELTSAASFGHSGATGCAMWVDPETALGCVLLTGTPGALRDGTLVRAANLLKACESPLE